MISTIDWQAVATRLGFATEREMWVEYYENRQMSADQLAEQFNVGRNPIRDALVRNDIVLRTPGRTPLGGIRGRERFTREELAEIKRIGIAEAARKAGFAYPTFYKRFRSDVDFYLREDMKESMK